MTYGADQASYKVQEIDDVFIVFNRLSGKTHFLNFFSHEILVLLSEEPQSEAAIGALALERLGLTDDDCPEGMAVRAVSELEACGLVYEIS